VLPGSSVSRRRWVLRRAFGRRLIGIFQPNKLKKREKPDKLDKPDGQPRRMLDVTRAEKEFGFRAKVSFEEGLKKTIECYLSTRKNR
jgi:nucleoside-diphosphate-sugar epimerase